MQCDDEYDERKSSLLFDYNTDKKNNQFGDDQRKSSLLFVYNTDRKNNERSVASTSPS